MKECLCSEVENRTNNEYAAFETIQICLEWDNSTYKDKEVLPTLQKVDLNCFVFDQVCMR